MSLPEHLASDLRLLETLAVVDGVPRHLALHLNRLLDSATQLGFVARRDDVERAATQAAAEHPRGLRRMRILVASGGEIEVQVLDPGTIPDRMTAAISTDPVPRDHPLLPHKTTERKHLVSRSVPGVDDTLLVNDRGEITEFVFGNIVVELDGRLLTPPLRCGLLPGIERRRALEAGRVVEAVLTADDVHRATAVWHLNSMRGWTPVDLSNSPVAPPDG